VHKKILSENYFSEGFQLAMEEHEKCKVARLLSVAACGKLIQNSEAIYIVCPIKPLYDKRKQQHLNH
jgi:hypothetical protein